MTALLQVSDAHFGTEVPEVVKALRRLIDELHPDLLVWTGDLTQRARRAQFEAARAFADSLPVPSVTMPGNHDIPLYNLPQRLVAPYAHYQASFGDELEPEIEREDLLLLMVKTTRRWRHKHGQLSPTQVQRVADRLRRATPQQLRIVATHQPMEACHVEDEHHEVRGPDEALAVWAEAGCDIVLSGHTHKPHCCAVNAGGRQLWMVQAGTALSSRLRAQPNSVNLIHHRAGVPAAEVERWDFVPEQGHFVRHSVTGLPLQR